MSIRMKLSSCCLALFALALPVSAQTIVQITQVPNEWKLENYSSNTVAVWYTPSNCRNGALILSSNVSAEIKNRFWSTVLTAKIANREIFVRYEQYEDGRSCHIRSFGLPNE